MTFRFFLLVALLQSASGIVVHQAGFASFKQKAVQLFNSEHPSPALMATLRAYKGSDLKTYSKRLDVLVHGENDSRAAVIYTLAYLDVDVDRNVNRLKAKYKQYRRVRETPAASIDYLPWAFYSIFISTRKISALTALWEMELDGSNAEAQSWFTYKALLTEPELVVTHLKLGKEIKSRSFLRVVQEEGLPEKVTTMLRRFSKQANSTTIKKIFEAGKLHGSPPLWGPRHLLVVI